MVSPKVIRAIRKQYLLSWHGIHGVVHWARVVENGLRLSATTGASEYVVWLFAVFHDSRRFNEDWDPEHGHRGAELAKSLRNLTFEISDKDFHLLYMACKHHTDGQWHADATIQTCWDADRLDLGRVGIVPDSRHLCTEAAKNPETIAWAYERSITDYVPKIVATQWNQD